MIRLAFWKEGFGQGQGSLGWRKCLEPVAVSRGGTMGVSARAGMLALETRQDQQDLVWD